MDRKGLEAALARGVEILGEFLPLDAWLVFPVLYSACVWAVRRVFDGRERVLARTVWLDPGFVRTKPDAFVLAFFSGEPALARAYAAEIAGGDLAALRAAFPALYAVYGLGDAFLRALFKAEIEAGDPRAVEAAFEARTARAVDAIRPAEADPRFWKALARVGREAASLGLHLLRDEEVQDMIVALVKGPDEPDPVPAPEP